MTRKRAQGFGGGRIRTNLNFLSLITEGNESQNIRLFDGDVVNVGRSTVVLREQLLAVMGFPRFKLGYLIPWPNY